MAEAVGGGRGPLLLYLAMLGLLWRLRPPEATLRDALRLLPDLVRLIKALAADRALSRRIRLRLALLLPGGRRALAPTHAPR